MSTELQLHPLCTLFPRITGAEFEALKSDIAEHGLRQPIVIHNGMILDGGNRYRACVEAGVEPRTVEFEGGNIVSFVLSSNLHRRHLSPGQQAAIVASAQDWAIAQVHGGDRKSDQSATLHLDSVAKRAAQSGASVRTQKMADKVAKEAPELAKKVAHGEVSLPAAVKQIAPPKPKAAPVADQLDEDAFGDFDPVAELDEATKENVRLIEQIAAIAADDPRAEAVKQVQRSQGLEARLGQEMDKNAQLDKDLRYFGKIMKELRDLLRVDENKKILGAVRALLTSKVA